MSAPTSVKVGDKIRVCINANKFPGHNNPAFVGGEYTGSAVEDGLPLVDGPGGAAPIESWVRSENFKETAS